MTKNTKIVAPASVISPSIRRRPRPGAAPEIANPDQASDYSVGWGKPPKQHRFKPGQSGNPRGRPKGARGLNAMTREILDKKIEMNVGGRTKKVRRIEALILKQVELGAKGNIRALQQLFIAYRHAVPDPIDRENEVLDEPMTDTDEAILELFRQEAVASHIKKEGSQ